MDSIKKLGTKHFLRFVPALYTNSFGNGASVQNGLNIFVRIQPDFSIILFAFPCILSN